MKEEKLSNILIPKDETFISSNNTISKIEKKHAGSKKEINDYLNFKNAFMCSLGFLGLYTAIYSA